jgi:hypothetical protein
MKTIKFYRLPSGKSPIEEFLDSLSSKEAQKVPKSEISLAQQRKNEYLAQGEKK